MARTNSTVYGIDMFTLALESDVIARHRDTRLPSDSSSFATIASAADRAVLAEASPR